MTKFRACLWRSYRNFRALMTFCSVSLNVTMLSRLTVKIIVIIKAVYWQKCDSRNRFRNETFFENFALSYHKNSQNLLQFSWEVQVHTDGLKLSYFQLFSETNCCVQLHLLFQNFSYQCSHVRKHLKLQFSMLLTTSSSLSHTVFICFDPWRLTQVDTMFGEL